MRRDGLAMALAASCLIGLAGIVAGAVLDPQAAAAAWLFAAIFTLGLPTGAISLVLAGRLTGGVWIETLVPALLPMARTVPLAIVAFVPLLFALPALYPWAAAGAHDPQVAAFYLNRPFVALRLAVAFAGWTAIAFFVIGVPGSRGAIAAALGLVFHVVMTTLLAYDWLLALQPGFTSSAFGALTAILFLLSALCLATLVAPLPEGKPARDIAGLIMAGILGAIYIGFMQFLIVWYGNLPETAAFYIGRATPAWTIVLVAAPIFGGAAPLAILISRPGRERPAPVRIAAFLALAGILLHWSWCALALFGPAAMPAAPFALLVLLAAFALAWDAARRGLAEGSGR